MREDGGLTIAKSVKFNVEEPDKDLPDLLPPAINDDSSFGTRRHGCSGDKGEAPGRN